MVVHTQQLFLLLPLPIFLLRLLLLLLWLLRIPLLLLYWVVVQPQEGGVLALQPGQGSGAGSSQLT